MFSSQIRGILSKITNRSKVLTAFRNGGPDKIRYGIPYNGGGIGLVLNHRNDDHLYDVAIKARHIANTLVVYRDYQYNASDFLDHFRTQAMTRLQIDVIDGIKIDTMYEDAIRSCLIMKGIMPVIIISNIDYPILQLDKTKVKKTESYLLYEGDHYRPKCWTVLHAFEECNWSSLIFSLHKPNYRYVYDYFNDTKVRPIGQY